MGDAPYPLRAVTDDELDGFFRMLSRAFGEDSRPEEVALDRLTAEADRTLAAFDGDELVGTAGAFTFDLAVPGGRLPAAGVTYVGVSPTHRRRGLLTSMMQRQLHDIHDRGEPVAILWASESSIYGRYGYGYASRRMDIAVDRVEARLRPDLTVDEAVELRLVGPDAMRTAVEDIERAVVDERPGQFVRDARWIETALADLESRRQGWSELQGVLASRDGRPVGYAAFATKGGAIRGHALSDGDVAVRAQRALDPGADLALTRLLLSLDLMRRVRWWNQPIDSWLPHLLADPRQAKSIVTDGLHARIVDARSALSGRRYVRPVDVAIAVADDRCPWNAGTWRLRAGSDGIATCERTDAAPDVTLEIEALGAAYLGGTPLTALAAAGRVSTTDPLRLNDLSVAFGWSRQPWCPVIF
jgi:predicted acetyltransferase